MDGPEAAALAVAALRDELAAVRAELAELKAALARLERPEARRRRKARQGRRLFLTVSEAAAAFGFGRTRMRALLSAGALRSVAFPNGERRIPRSELERVDALGLDVWLADAEAKAGAAPLPAPPPAVEEVPEAAQSEPPPLRAAGS